MNSDDGVATVWAAAAVAVLTTVLAACLHLGAALLARHRAESAADLAALAAAREAVRGRDRGVPTRGGDRRRRGAVIVARCRLVGWRRARRGTGAGAVRASRSRHGTGQAMAGPDPVGQPRVGERSMDTAGRADTASAAFAA